MESQKSLLFNHMLPVKIRPGIPKPVRQTRLNRGNYRTGESAIFAPEKSPDQEYLAQ